MIKCIIIDDEPLAIQLLSDYVEKAVFLQLEACFSDPIKAMQYINDNDIDLVFLDIQMPELTGIQFMKITNNKVHFIMTTAYDQYALEGYDYNVIDFLLKPITFERFMIASHKAQDRLSEKAVSPTPVTIPVKDAKNYIFVKSEYKVQKINLDEILFFEAMGDYVVIQLAEAKILTLENIKSFVERLPKEQFMRVHRSYIISFSKIDFIERNRIKIHDKLIPISNSHQKEFWERTKM